MSDNGTEEKILNATLEVIVNNSISGTRISLIAEKAGIVLQTYIIIIKRNKMSC